MLEWYEYIERLLQNRKTFEGINISIGEDGIVFGIPPIIESSIFMLDSMIEHQGKYNIMVFPERSQSIFIFTMMKLLHNITEGRISKLYDPSSFSLGEKLKLGNVVVEFLGIKQHDGKVYLEIGLADLITSAPVEFFPFFQRTNTHRRLSKYSQFVAAKKKAELLITSASSKEQHLKSLADYKTHMDSSIFFMTSIINTKEIIKNFFVCGSRITDIFLIGQTDYTGTIRNVSAGQMEGVPSIVLAPDLYAITNAARNSKHIQSVIIDASDSNRISTQMDALDEIMCLNVPITCITDIVNSFDLELFERRGFNIWRWDDSSITDKLYDVTPLNLDKKNKHCATRNVKYIEIKAHVISDAIKRLYSHRIESKEQSIQMMRIFDNLNSLAFSALRETIPFGKNEIERAQTILTGCLQILANERPFLTSSTYDDYIEIVKYMKIIYSVDYQLMKNRALKEYIQNSKYKYICIVVPSRSDKKQIQEYWQSFCQQRKICTIVQVLYPSEYYNVGCTNFSATIIVGWLKRAIMRKILYSFNTQQFIVLLYDYECRWKNYDTFKWNSSIKRSNNSEIINKSFSSNLQKIAYSSLVDENKLESTEIPENDELNEIELILRENKYRQYIARDGTKTACEMTEAVPVNFVGGYIAFYRNGHKIISATKIITHDAEKIETVLPDQLQVGDFIVVREADRDLIKEMADIILENSGLHGIRRVATKWKEVFEIEKLFLTPEKIYQKLVNAGCTKGYATVRSWLMDDDVIAPQQKQDLNYIATATESDVITEMIDQIFDAAQEVRAAHVQAGRALSAQLRNKVVEALENYGDIEPFNIWEPIEMNLEGIGMVKVLKIIDVGLPIIVDTADTNHLIAE